MARLDVEEIREVHRNPRLCNAFHEAVRETAHMQAMKGPNAVRPFLGERQSVTAEDLKASPLRIVGTDLEARRAAQTAELVGPLVYDERVLGDAVNPEPPRVDQRRVVAIERPQIFVVETGPLAVI